MTDLWFILLTLAFFALALLFVAGCEGLVRLAAPARSLARDNAENPSDN